MDQQGDPLLINPVDDDPQDHLELGVRTGRYLTESPKGMATISVFRLNREELVRGRIDAWRSLELLFREYVRLQSKGTPEAKSASELYLDTIRGHAFTAMRDEMRLMLDSGSPHLDKKLRSRLINHPELIS